MIRIFIGIFLFAIFSNSLLAETYAREHTYNAIQADNKITSRIIALDQVRTFLLQKIASHIQQIIKITEYGSVDSYAKKDVEAITANLTKVNILEEKWDEKSYYIKAEIEADTQRVLDALKEYKNDHSEKSRQLLKALKVNERALQKSRKNITRLRRELDFAKTDSQITKLVAEYTTELNKLSTEEIFARGFNHHQQGEYSEAIKWYRKIAKQGNAVAQQLLGLLYMKGQGVEQDFTKAIYWYRKAAEQDEAIAQYYLGILYLKGDGVEQDISKAVDWLHRSAEQEDALAQYKLGSMYLDGKGVEQKYFMAVHWFRKAAEQREAIAQYSLGMMYAHGKGVAQNNAEAIYWYRKAAKQGLNEAKQMIKEIEKGAILN